MVFLDLSSRLEARDGHVLFLPGALRADSVSLIFHHFSRGERTIWRLRSLLSLNDLPDCTRFLNSACSSREAVQRMLADLMGGEYNSYMSPKVNGFHGG
jgi:hypothetical protein